MSELKDELNTELSRLIREYKSEGMSSEDIRDSLDWHADLALARSSD